jgi:glycosyltransferase involved in cell wall biosynthesis
MTIINIVDNLLPVNFGIWNAAIATAPYLHDRGIETELWFPFIEDAPNLPHVHMVPLHGLGESSLKKMLKMRALDIDSTIVVTHGCWQFATRWGSAMKKMGYKWVYVPHGMLEPWSMAQKKWKKRLYFNYIEFPLSQKADAIRAVGSPELTNLQKRFSNATLIPNGIHPPSLSSNDKWESTSKMNYLFMARLHEKKGVVPLVEAWLQSPLFNNGACHLYIAGPNDGQLMAVQSLINKYPDTNITYLGGVYGDDKVALLNQCHIYLLPSHSEGFPTSVLEAMSYRLIPVITDGCNFPEAIEAEMAFRITPNTPEIINALKWLHRQSTSKLGSDAENAGQWVMQHYSNQAIANKQAELYIELLNP